MDSALMMLVMAAVPGYFVIQPLAVLRWRGGWRIAALAPLLLVLPALAFSLYAFTKESNLWPMALFIAAVPGTFYLSALWLVRWWIY